MRTVLFTGAGASSAIGYPLTIQMMPMVRAQLKAGTLFRGLGSNAQANADRRTLSSYLRRLYPGFARTSDEELPLITEVFSLVEYSLANGEALTIGGSEPLRRLRDLLKQAITDLILDEYEAPWNLSDPAERGQRRVLRKLTRWLAAHGGDIGYVSTNYDVGVESEIYRQLGVRKLTASIDLGFEWRNVFTGETHVRVVDRTAVRVYKLHGSVDQLRCSSCGHVYFNPEGTMAHQAFRRTLTESNTCHCRHHVRHDLHIIPPSLVRDIRDANLLNVWKSALEWMRTADRWVIVGYSLPAEDLAIRSLLMRAYSTAQKPPRITVVQDGAAARSRYSLIFPRLDYHDGGLEAFLNDESF